MSEADVLYTDVTFTRVKENDNTSSSIETTYAEVNISKSQPSSELPASQQQAESGGRPKVTCGRVVVAVVIIVLLAAAAIAVGFTFFKTSKFPQNEHQAVKGNFTDRPCLKCEAGWELHGAQCYYFSTDSSTWESSKDKCRARGGDLVKVDSREEQEFLEDSLRDKMMGDEDKFWIGLTDSKDEKKWLWVDGSPLHTSLSFWNIHEPDNWMGEDEAGENCVRMGERAGATDLLCWFDKSCMKPHRRICEKRAETEPTKCV